jgi:hypothetical protein
MNRKIRYILTGLLSIFIHTCLVLAVHIYARYSNNSFSLFLIFLAVAPIYWTTTILYKRSKIWAPEIRDSLLERGLTLIDERPLTLKESLNYLDWTPQVAIMVNDTPIESVGKTFANRVINVQTLNGEKLTLCIEIIKLKYSGKIDLNIIKQIEKYKNTPISIV